MNTSNYDHSDRAAQATPPGERIHGPPSSGLTFIWVVWLLAAAVLLVFGVLIFAGIVSSVA